MRKTVILLDLGSEEVSREVTDYMGEYEYKNKVLSRIHNTEGAAVRQSNGSFLYEYTLKDHLGNTRVTFSDVNGDLSINPDNEVSQINHYAPFGLNLEGNWNGQNGANKVQYNGKEWNDDFGLGWNDYGARFYDPAMARWLAVDPLAEKYNHWSPYNYGMDSPIVNIDPDGRSAMPGRETNESEDYNNRPTVAELISKAERSNGHWDSEGGYKNNNAPSEQQSDPDKAYKDAAQPHGLTLHHADNKCTLSSDEKVLEFEITAFMEAVKRNGGYGVRSEAAVNIELSQEFVKINVKNNGDVAKVKEQFFKYVKDGDGNKIVASKLAFLLNSTINNAQAKDGVIEMPNVTQASQNYQLINKFLDKLKIPEEVRRIIWTHGPRSIGNSISYKMGKA